MRDQLFNYLVQSVAKVQWDEDHRGAWERAFTRVLHVFFGGRLKAHLKCQELERKVKFLKGRIRFLEKQRNVLQEQSYLQFLWLQELGIDAASNPYVREPHETHPDESPSPRIPEGEQVLRMSDDAILEDFAKGVVDDT